MGVVEMTMLEKMVAAIKPLIPDECFQDDVAEHHAAIIARAALLAIRDAGPEALAAGMAAAAPGQGSMASILEYDNRGADSLAASFTAMIDAILAEKLE